MESRPSSLPSSRKNGEREQVESIRRAHMQENTASRALPAGTSVDIECPTRIITYGWGERYVDVLLTFTLPALLAPGNLPYVASQVPCELVILTQRRYFSKFNCHPTVARIREFCPVRLVRLDDLIVSKDKYGMTLTYALHRAFSDLGPAMTEHWQIFLNADFILADGSLRTVIGHLARGERIVASPSYCTNAEEVIPELRKHFDPATSALRISHRELARLILQHRHTVIRGKTVNQSAFHMRYADQFYWSADEGTLLGYQMPVSIVGLRPQRHVLEPSSYWDFGLIWEYCPDAEICVIGDSDEFTMLELRDKSVAEDQVVTGPPDKKAIAELMVTWVTPYQQHFLKFPLTLHDDELPPSTGDARMQLRTFVDEVMSNAPALPSHIKHSQWQYHYPGFHHARQMSSRIRRWFRTKVELAISPAVRVLRRCRAIVGFLCRKVMEWAKDLFRPVVRVLLDDYLRPALRRFSLEIVKSDTLIDLAKKAFVLLPSRDIVIAQLKQEQTADRSSIADLSTKVADLTNIATEYQLKLERSYDYQAIMSQDQLRVGMSNLEPEFLALYEQCREYTMTSWERLYAFYKSVQYVIQNKIPGDLVECGVWRGGGMKLAAQALLALGSTDRRLFLYDTFEGMTEPDPAVDVDSSGNKAVNDWTEIQRRGVKWSYASIEEVRDVIAGSGYPMDKVVLVKGRVEETIPATVPDSISLLRLDTDWYSSTKHEIEHLYPRLLPHGVLILDDYGHYRGAQQAIDEYFDRAGKRPFLNRVDYSCRLAIKSQ
jgi:O-methyltransferase